MAVIIKDAYGNRLYDKEQLFIDLENSYKKKPYKKDTRKRRDSKMIRVHKDTVETLHKVKTDLGLSSLNQLILKMLEDYDD
jgi:hypothetical protein